jgi:hypothetical protein
MGLAINVGMLADLIENDEEGANWLRETFRQMNEVLLENDLPSHDEPEQLPPFRYRAQLMGYSYSFLHYLRRFYAHIENDSSWIPTPTAADEDPTQDSVLEEEMYMMSSHLLCHSDAAGFYLPIAFEQIVIDTGEGDRIPGGIVGSSYQLMSELVTIAPYLGIKLRGGQLTDEEATKINTAVDAEQEFWIEKMVWISLFEAARLSIEYKSAICFA